jgi:opacity protein-like surface antigen
MKTLFHTLQCALFFVAQAGAEEPPRFEAFGGYSLAHVNIATNVPNASPSHVNENGFNIAATAYFTRWLGATGDFSGHFNTSSVSYNDPFSKAPVRANITSRVYPLHFGPQVRLSRGRVSSFARVMFGLFRIRTEAQNFHAFDNDFSFLVGGGVDVRPRQHWGIRVGQFDYIRSHLTPTDWQDNLEVFFRDRLLLLRKRTSGQQQAIAFQALTFKRNRIENGQS